jgi:DNA-binding response OmpR family regulator
MRVLVVEDDPLLGDALQTGLKQRGFDARLPQGALARLKVDSATRQIAWRAPAIVTD